MRQPRAAKHDGPVHVVLDSTGLQVFGQGEWNAEKHGRTSRQWRKLHLAVDAETGEIVAHVLTDKDVGDIGAVPGLLATVEGPVGNVIADGAYDGASVYKAASLRQHVLAGSAMDIGTARRARRMMGGAMRQIGCLAAAGLYALDHHVGRLGEDHATARAMAEVLAASPAFAFNLASVRTNIMIADMSAAAPDAATIVARA